MIIVLDIFARVVSIIINAVLTAMFIRLILSFFTGPDESRVTLFLACITEPFITPIRFLLYKFNILQNTPVDWSFTITYVVLSFVNLLLPVL